MLIGRNQENCFFRCQKLIQRVGNTGFCTNHHHISLCWGALSHFSLKLKSWHSCYVQDVGYSGSISSIIDQRLDNSSTTVRNGEELIQLKVQCVNPSSEMRPAMSCVVAKVERKK